MSKLVIENLSERKDAAASDIRGGMKWTRGHKSKDVIDTRPSGETGEVYGVNFFKTVDGFWMTYPS